MRLLLDEHLSPALARQLRQRGIDALAIWEWHDGAYRNVVDPTLLAAAYVDGRVLVTYDQRTIPPILREWAETGQVHAGVVFVDERTIRQSDMGGRLRAIVWLVMEHGQADWTNRVDYLRRA